MRAVVQELLARDLVVLNGIDADFFQGEEDYELVRVRTIEKRPGHGLPMEGFAGYPVLRFLAHRILTGGLFAVACNRKQCQARQLHKIAGNRSNRIPTTRVPDQGCGAVNNRPPG